MPDWHKEAVGLIQQNFTAVTSAFLDATRRAAWLGLFLNYVKVRGKQDKSIPHGQFRPWLKSNLPDVSTSQACFYMTLGRNLAEKASLQMSGNRNFATVVNAGQIPESVEKLISGKTQNALFLEYKQAEENRDELLLKPKRGNLSGKGNPKINRVLAQEAEEKARLEALDLRAVETSEWLMQIADDKHLGLISDLSRAQLLESMDVASAYIRRLESAKKGTPQ